MRCAGASGAVNTVDMLTVRPPSTTSAPSTTAPATSAAPPPSTTSPGPPPPPPPPAPFPCKDECLSCCCPGCHAIDGTCYACAAGSYSSDCSNHTQSSCSVCPSGFFCPGGASQPSECPSGTQAGQGAADASQCAVYSVPQLLPAAIVAAIVICVLLVNLVHACFFVRRNAIKLASSKAWILACVMLGPLVWPMWWYRQRAFRRANVNAPLLTMRGSESEPRASGPAPLPPAASAPPLEYSQRLNHNGLRDSRMIVKPSAPPADDEAYAAVAQPVLAHAGGSAARAAAAAVAPNAAARQPAAGSLPLAPSLDQPTEDMTDQCPPPPPINSPSPVAHARAAAVHTLVLRVASAV